MQIAVTIQNLENATNYSSKIYIFDESGGDIGSDSSSALFCQDVNSSIQPRHARISYEEGFFTIAPYENCDVFYNDSFSKLAIGYETVINEGDIFRVGDLKLIFINPSKITEYADKTQKLIENTPNFDRLDDIHLEPRGKILDVDFKEQPNVGVFPEKNDEFYIMNEPHTHIREVQRPLAQQTTQNMLSSQNLDSLIEKFMAEFHTDIKPSPIETNCATLSVKDLEAILLTIPLSNSTKLVNTVLIKLVCKELYSHMYDIVENNSFFKYLSDAITKSTQEKKAAFEYLVLKALESYISKK
ncbi:MAG: hypothetical protein LUC34_00115 [Campylobacter sp.]|nr:hypothetical protein [Campylobacter sp.]